MSPPIISRRSLAAFAAAWLTLSGSVNAATVLVEFDFDDAFGNFEISSEAQHPELASATFSVTTGALTDYAGNPGRALATNAFAPLNAIRLTLTARPGSGLQLEHLRFRLAALGERSPAMAGGRKWHCRCDGNGEYSFQHRHRQPQLDAGTPESVRRFHR